MIRNFKFIVSISTIILLLFSVAIFAQENIPLEPEQITESSEAIDRAVAQDASSLTTLQQSVQSVVPSGSQVQVDVVRVVPGNVPEVYIRHTINWIEFLDKTRIDTPSNQINIQSSAAIQSQLQSAMSIDLLEKPIISQNDANTVLSSCDPGLKVVVKKLRSPFFNNWTGVHWDSKSDYLAVEAIAVVDAANNKCVKGIVDLRTSEVVCMKDIACKVN